MARGRHQVRVVERDGGKATLKQVPGPARPGVDEAGVLPMRLADRAREAVGRRRREHEMHMVGHQAIGPDRGRSPAAAFGEQIAVERVVGRFEEDRLAAIAALGYVMRKSRRGMSRALLKLAKRSLPMIILRDFELLVKNSII
jgi:hypothetical protein